MGGMGWTISDREMVVRPGDGMSVGGWSRMGMKRENSSSEANIGLMHGDGGRNIKRIKPVISIAILALPSATPSSNASIFTSINNPLYIYRYF